METPDGDDGQSGSDAESGDKSSSESAEDAKGDIPNLDPAGSGPAGSVHESDSTPLAPPPSRHAESRRRKSAQLAPELLSGRHGWRLRSSRPS